MGKEDYFKQLRKLQESSDVYGLLMDKLKSRMWARIFLWLNLNKGNKKNFFSSNLMFDLNLINIDYANKILLSMVNIGLISKIGKIKQRIQYRITGDYLDDGELLKIAKKTLNIKDG